MFESGKKQQKTAKNSEETRFLLPTPEQVLKLWLEHFEPLLKFTEGYDKELLEKFENDPLQYIKDIKTPQK